MNQNMNILVQTVCVLDATDGENNKTNHNTGDLKEKSISFAHRHKYKSLPLPKSKIAIRNHRYHRRNITKPEKR